MFSGVLSYSAEQCADQCPSEGGQFEHGRRSVGRTSRAQRYRPGQYSFWLRDAVLSLRVLWRSSNAPWTSDCAIITLLDCYWFCCRAVTSSWYYRPDEMKRATSLLYSWRIIFLLLNIFCFCRSNVSNISAASSALRPLPSPSSLFSSTRRHLSCDGCLEDKREDYQNW